MDAGVFEGGEGGWEERERVEKWFEEGDDDDDDGNGGTERKEALEGETGVQDF